MEENKVMETEVEEIKEDKKETTVEETKKPSKVKNLIKWGLIGLGSIGVAAAALAVVLKKEEVPKEEDYSPLYWAKLDADDKEPDDGLKLVATGSIMENRWAFTDHPEDKGYTFSYIPDSVSNDDEKPEET